MNNKIGLILRLILGGYLIFLGVSVIMQAVQTEPSDFVMKVLFGALFILVGGAYAISQIRKIYHLVKKEKGETEERDAKTSTRPLFNKPKYDESLYRTAPMPTEEISKKIPAQATDLRANMSHLEEEEKEAVTQTEQEKVKEQAKQPVDLAEQEQEVPQNENAQAKQSVKETGNKQTSEIKQTAEIKQDKTDKEPEKREVKPQKSQLGIQVEEKREVRSEVKDPVNLAIEIMRNEDKELAEEAEEFEKDYEEK